MMMTYSRKWTEFIYFLLQSQLNLLPFVEEIKNFPSIYLKEADKQLETLVPVCVVH